MTEKSKRSLEERQRFSSKQLLAVSIVAVSLIVSGSLFSFWLTKAPEAKFSLKAIIVDQLGKEPDFLNTTFVSSATDVLKSGGFNVTYYNQTIDVNFYRNLAKSDYGIIVLRAHTAKREDNSTIDIFTSERFVQGAVRYQDELNNQLVTVGEFLFKEGEYYYAVTSKFIDSLEGRFPKSIVIAMGCWSLVPGLDDKLPKSFINKGASAYVGWTDLVTAPDTDAETIRLLTSLLVQNRTLSDAVSRTSGHAYIVNGQPLDSKLRSYPSDANDLKVSTLINEAKAAMTFQNNRYLALNFNGTQSSPRKKSNIF